MGPIKREGEGQSRVLLQKKQLLLRRGARDGVVLKRLSGLRQNTPRDEFEWRLVMSPGAGDGQQDSGSVIKTINHGDSEGAG